MSYLNVFIPDSVIKGCSWSEACIAAKYFDQFPNKIIVDDWDRHGKWVLVKKSTDDKS